MKFNKLVSFTNFDTNPAPFALTDEQIRHIFVEVALGRGRHGSFLRRMAEATAHADPRNFALLRPLLKTWIEDYDLAEYLDTHKPENGLSRARGA